MEAKFRAHRSDLESPTYVVAAILATILLAVVISAGVVYFIGSTLPYAGSPDYTPSPIHVGVSTAGEMVDLPAAP